MYLNDQLTIDLTGTYTDDEGHDIKITSYYTQEGGNKIKIPDGIFS